MSVILPQGGWYLPLGSKTNAILGLAVLQKKPCHRVSSALQALNPQLLSGLKVESSPHHPFLICLFWLGPKYAAVER